VVVDDVDDVDDVMVFGDKDRKRKHMTGHQERNLQVSTRWLVSHQHLP
jgi:hypothetical protein